MVHSYVPNPSLPINQSINQSNSYTLEYIYGNIYISSQCISPNHTLTSMVSPHWLWAKTQIFTSILTNNRCHCCLVQEVITKNWSWTKIKRKVRNRNGATTEPTASLTAQLNIHHGPFSWPSQPHLTNPSSLNWSHQLTTNHPTWVSYHFFSQFYFHRSYFHGRRRYFPPAKMCYIRLIPAALAPRNRTPPRKWASFYCAELLGAGIRRI